MTVTHLTGPLQGDSELFHELPLVIGRSARGHVRVDDDLVSTRHVEVHHAGGARLEVRDLRSKNGVWVDGVRVEESAAVSSGCVLELGPGGPRLRVEVDPEAFSISFGELRRQTARRTRGDVAPLFSTVRSLVGFAPDEASDSASRLRPPDRGSGRLVLLLGLIAAAGLAALLALVR